MDYMTVTEAAEKWGVSVRQVQRLISAGRIPGAALYGKTYVLPADSTRPGDPRFAPEPEHPLPSDFAAILAATTKPAPRDNPDAFIANIKDERARRQYEADMAYIRGGFERTLHCFRQTEGDDAARLRAASTAIAAAISLGDYHFFQLIESYLKSLVQKNISGEITALAELALACAYTSAFAPNMVAGWLKDGDFSVLSHPRLRLDAAYKRAKYFQCLKDYASMLAVAQTALAFGAADDEMNGSDIYLRVSCAVASYETGRVNDAKRHLFDAMKICLPHGAITPFAENVYQLGGLVDQLLKREFPAHYDAVMEQMKRTVPNWFSFHNRFTSENILGILDSRDYQIAARYARGDSYRKIAEQFNISISTVGNTMQKVYEQLLMSGSNRRQQLAKFTYS